MEQNLFFDVAKIASNDGYALSMVGVVIVFVTLSIISLFVGFLPHILKLIDWLFFKKTASNDIIQDNEKIALAIAVTMNNKN